MNYFLFFLQKIPFANQLTMQHPPFLIKSILIVLYCCCCCSFSAVPAKQAPPQKKLSVKEKRQIRQQQRRLYRTHKQQQRQQLAPPKNHAKLNIIGFILIMSSIGFLVLGAFFVLAVFGIFGSIVSIALGLVLGLAIAIMIAGAVLCILGLIGAKEADHPKRGFSIAGLIIVGIPIVILLIVLFVALLRILNVLA
ncbi:MAG: hypothetical protein ACRBFS_16180 [Aureispira sp.]